MTNFISQKSILPRQRLIMALDVPTSDQARQLVTTLGDSVGFYKIGMELFMAGDYFQLIDWLKQNDKQIFVDLKFFDVPATVARAIDSLSQRGVDFATIHGNQSIMEAAVKTKGDLKILAVTALTSLDQGDLDDLGFQCSIEELVLSRARRAFEAGCDGVISSGLEVPRLREEVNQQLLVVSPGIRPVTNRQEDDQKRVVTVTDAFNNGADYIVVGRPIRDAEHPAEMALSIQQQIADVFTSQSN
ncbi:MAG: orotidine-5'-phosphate decarboxylase [Gammaproteobacteria bacterium]|nr:orotidine-5'-phosphate decarboxylase [Gammaproteobacteria bacterium]